jgi:hypothetical protein
VLPTAEHVTLDKPHLSSSGGTFAFQDRDLDGTTETPRLAPGWAQLPALRPDRGADRQSAFTISGTAAPASPRKLWLLALARTNLVTRVDVGDLKPETTH